jgi:hypothetical protein
VTATVLGWMSAAKYDSNEQSSSTQLGEHP